MTPSMIALLGGLMLGTAFGYVLRAALERERERRRAREVAPPAALIEYERMEMEAAALRRRSALRNLNLNRRA